ncbi:p-loop containing nucleoside triphosphate hydrolase protein, partial [Haematococcus lacustris]
VIRLGNPTKIQPELLKTTLDYRMKNHPTFPELQQLVDQIVRISRQLSELRGSAWSAVQGEEFVKELRAEKRALQVDINDLRHTMKKDIVMGAQVVCSTCIGAGSPDLKGFSFPLLVLDEGSQASEPEALVPIMKGTHQVIIVGDHKQLPPTVMSEKALAKGLGVSLFERMTEAG